MSFISRVIMDGYGFHADRASTLFNHLLWGYLVQQRQRTQLRILGPKHISLARRGLMNRSELFFVAQPSRAAADGATPVCGKYSGGLEA
jgi:hypothetical protein